MNERKTILFVTANPTYTQKVNSHKELREIIKSLTQSKFGEYFNFQSSEAARPKDLRRDLLNSQANIVHFSGHGSKDCLIFEDEKGFSKPIGQEAFENLIGNFSDHLECVILNACHSSNIADAIAKYVNYVIGMNNDIPDESAIQFSIGFYDALGAGRTIEDAFNIGVSSIKLENLPGGEIPFLRKKIGINNEPITLTIQSYKHDSQDVIESADHMLSLLDFFIERKKIKGTWDDLKEPIKQFISQNIKAMKKYRIYIPLHSSLAFFLGKLLDFKSGAEISIFQVSNNSFKLWPLNPKFDKTNSEYGDWKIANLKTENNGNGIAVAISISNKIRGDVEKYINKHQPSIGNLVHIYLDEPNQQAIKDASHAYYLACRAADLIKDKYRELNATRLHLFFSVPNAFVVMLGRQMWTLNNITIYEHNTGTSPSVIYEPSITI